ncbi:hypothetical protein L210DRAFT_3502054 [Boletus edulis BED1]|uniref:Uncharacterized protein n=1 Tax=Boletus edulis BED1 TaxID=1328754 RepID=A0AAD4GHB9_BOLED|nr:hypothetical protein L210DRAFT_3502054 [Boletus edulis BED1]
MASGDRDGDKGDRVMEWEWVRLSTIGSVFGNAGQAAYRALELYLDRIADVKQARLNLLTGMTTAQVCNLIGGSLIRKIAHYVPMLTIGDIPWSLLEMCTQVHGMSCYNLPHEALHTSARLEGGSANNLSVGGRHLDGLLCLHLVVEPPNSSRCRSLIVDHNPKVQGVLCLDVGAVEEAYKSEGRMDVCPSLGKSPMVDGVIACPCLCPKDVCWGPSCPYGDSYCCADFLLLGPKREDKQVSEDGGAGFNLNGNFTFGSNLVADVGDDEEM